MLKQALIALSCILTVFAGQANHVLGGFISYEALGDNHYQVNLFCYVDCFGTTPALETTNVFFLAEECLAFSASLNLMAQEEISDLCDDLLDQTSCNDGIAPGVVVCQYTVEDVELDPSCDWEIRWQTDDWYGFENALESGIATAVICTELFEPNISTPNIPVHVVPVVSPGQDMWSNMFAVAPEGLTTLGEMVPLKTLESNDLVNHTLDPPISTAEWNEINAYLLGAAPEASGYHGFGVKFESWTEGEMLANRINYASTVIVAAPESYGVDEVAPFFISPAIQNVENGDLLNDHTVEVVAGDEVCFEVWASMGGEAFTQFYTTVFDEFPDADATWTAMEENSVLFVCLETTEEGTGEFEFQAIAQGFICGNLQEFFDITILVVEPDPCLDSEPITQETVSIDSILQLLAEWGGVGDSCGADLDGDNVVTILDLLILLSWFTG